MNKERGQRNGAKREKWDCGCDGWVNVVEKKTAKEVKQDLEQERNRAAINF